MAGRKNGHVQEEISVAPLGDIHDGRVTLSYSPDVAVERVDRWTGRVNRVREILTAGGYALNELVVPMVGDMVDGEGVYDTQHAHVAIKAPPDQVQHLVHEVMVPALRKLAAVWPSVRLLAVPGNHGRVGKHSAETSNWDISFYDALDAEIRSNPRLGDKIGPIERGKRTDPFFMNTRIGNHKFLLYHGSRLTRANAMNRMYQWQSSAIGPFEVMIMGHLHHLDIEDGNGNTTLVMNGTPMTDDDHSLLLGHDAPPRWWMFGVSKSRPITWQFRLDLEEV